MAIVDMLARSLGRTEIARELECSVSTVDRRMIAMRQRLGVHTNIQVVVHAVRHGLI